MGVLGTRAVFGGRGSDLTGKSAATAGGPPRGGGLTPHRDPPLQKDPPHCRSEVKRQDVRGQLHAIQEKGEGGQDGQLDTSAVTGPC